MCCIHEPNILCLGSLGHLLACSLSVLSLFCLHASLSLISHVPSGREWSDNWEEDGGVSDGSAGGVDQEIPGEFANTFASGGGMGSGGIYGKRGEDRKKNVTLN